jgi:ribosome-associated protein
MIEINPSLSIEESELKLDFLRASGPGGQNVNKVSTGVQLRFDIRSSPSLPEGVKDRLVRLGGRRVTGEGVLVIEARRFRTQEKNRLDAIQRFMALVTQAAVEPKARKKTRPGVTAKAARLKEKKARGETKRLRSYDPKEWE